MKPKKISPDGLLLQMTNTTVALRKAKICVYIRAFVPHQFWSPLLITEEARHSFSLTDQGSVGPTFIILCSVDEWKTQIKRVIICTVIYTYKLTMT